MHLAKQTSSSSIVCFGGANVDRKHFAHKKVQPRITNHASSVLTFGGVARNVSEALCYLGFDTSLITCFGEDADAELLRNDLSKLNIRTEQSFVMQGMQTGFYHALIDVTGDLYVSAVSNLDIYQLVTVEMIEGVWSSISQVQSVFLDTFFSAECIQYILARCKGEGKCLTVNPVSPLESMKLPEDLTGVQLLVASESEASSLSGLSVKCTGDHRSAADRILARGVESLVITCADKGAYCYNALGVNQHIAPPKAEIVDTIGAGDSFIAGMLYSKSKNDDFLTSCKYGLAAAALTVQEKETVSKTLSVDTIENTMRLMRDM